MKAITIDPVVLEKLKASFPKPKNAAEKALKKYQNLLEDLLFKADLRGRTNFELMFNLYSIPVADLTHKGPQIGGSRIRLHSWLNENDFELVHKEEIGTNLTGRVSLVKLTELVTYQDGQSEIANSVQSVTTAEDLDAELCNDIDANANTFAKIYADYLTYLSKRQREQVFDLAPVDIRSLQAYIYWLNIKATKISRGKVRTYTDQALLILSVAKHTGGYFPQRKKPSPFGRIYYSGISVQNINKELRRAMLGDCWEYDIRSSVIAWKQSFAKELTWNIYPTKECSTLFWASIWYLERRNEFMLDVRTATFGVRSDLSIEFQNTLIKLAITAISFGARANVNGWREANGAWAQPSIAKDVLTNAQQRRNFFNCYTVQCFVKEQSMLDSYLANILKQERADIYFGELITRNVQPSKSKAVAFLYQHSETQVMGIAISVLLSHGINPIARVHDAFIVRDKLPKSVREEIISEMQVQTQNNYWRLMPQKLDGYKFSN